MSSDMPVENKAPMVSNKQYALLVDELNMALMSRLIPGVKYCEIVGMGLSDNKEYQALVTPVPKPKEEIPGESYAGDA